MKISRRNLCLLMAGACCTSVLAACGSSSSSTASSSAASASAAASGEVRDELIFVIVFIRLVHKIDAKAAQVGLHQQIGRAHV